MPARLFRAALEGFRRSPQSKLRQNARGIPHDAGKPISIVTGGAGFFGSHVVDALIARGDIAIVIDDLSTGSFSNLGGAIESGNCMFVYGDLVQCATRLDDILAQMISQPVARIFHLASPVSPSACAAHPWETLACNGPVTMALIELALRHEATFIFGSASDIYGDAQVHPQPESYYGNVDPIGRHACYNEGKRFGEAAVAVAVRSMRLDGRIARLFNCYGPRMQLGDDRLIPAALRALKSGMPLALDGTGRQTRSMTYIDDAVEAVLLLADSHDLCLTPFNIGGDDERSVAQIIAAVARAAGVSFEIVHRAARAGDSQQRFPDLSLARSHGWRPKTSLEDGLSRTLAWYRDATLVAV